MSPPQLSRRSYLNSEWVSLRKAIKHSHQIIKQQTNIWYMVKWLSVSHALIKDSSELTEYQANQISITSDCRYAREAVKRNQQIIKPGY